MYTRSFLPFCLTTSLALAGATTSAFAQPKVQLEVLGSVTSTPVAEGSAEIVAYDPITQQLYVINAPETRVDVIDISKPAKPKIVGSIDAKAYGASANSVAVKNGIIAIAIEAEVKTDPGYAVLFNSNLEFKAQFTVGALPDMITFTPDGKYVLVANEGEPSDDYSIDPEGSISIIDISGGLDNLTSENIRTADFKRFKRSNLPKGVRITGPAGTTVAKDIEPEYIAVSSNSRKAWVSLQENNSLAIVDIPSAKVLRIAPLGSKNYNLAGNGIDASNEDGAIRIKRWPVRGLYMPDGIASYKVQGKDFVILANEGDAREWGDYLDEARIEDIELSPKVFPNAAALKKEQNLGRLKISAVDGVNPNGKYSTLYGFGARSFSIRNAAGTLVWDSGNDFERITAEADPEHFNSSHDNNDFDDRSDDKGPEPEGVAIGEIDGRFYAFIGLERISGIMVYDVTNPEAPKFQQYIDNRDFSVDVTTPAAGDLGPEGIVFIKSADSPNGKPLVAVGNEISGTTTIYQVNSVQP